MQLLLRPNCCSFGWPCRQPTSVPIAPSLTSHALNINASKLQHELIAGARSFTPSSPNGICDNEMLVSQRLLKMHVEREDRDVADVDAVARVNAVQ